MQIGLLQTMDEAGTLQYASGGRLTIEYSGSDELRNHAYLPERYSIDRIEPSEREAVEKATYRFRFMETIDALAEDTGWNIRENPSAFLVVAWMVDSRIVDVSVGQFQQGTEGLQSLRFDLPLSIREPVGFPIFLLHDKDGFLPPSEPSLESIEKQFLEAEKWGDIEKVQHLYRQIRTRDEKRCQVGFE